MSGSKLPVMLSKLRWIGAWLLAIAGGGFYLITQADWAWWVGMAACLPLLCGALNRLEGVTSHGGGGDGPWGAP